MKRRRCSGGGASPSDPLLVRYGATPEGWGDVANRSWALRRRGPAQVRVLDGGCLRWLAGGGTATLPDDAPAPTASVPDEDPSVSADPAWVAGGDGCRGGPLVWPARPVPAAVRR